MLHIDKWTTPDETPTLPSAGELHIWKIEVATPGMDLSHLLSSDEQLRRQNLLHEADRIRFGNARGSMRTILAGYLDSSPEKIQFNYSEKGKPLLDNITTPLQFNLTHAGELALLAISPDLPVGIDLERDQLRNNLRSIAKKVFDTELFTEIEALEDGQFMRAFFLHWTQLEARVKAIGEGVFSRTPRHKEIPCINFLPLDGWCAAVAIEGNLPTTDRWLTLKFP